jgi:hypothetical protein
MAGQSDGERKRSTMAIRHLLICTILGGFIVSAVPFTPLPAEAAQSVKKKHKQVDEKKRQQKHVKKRYPWGEPNAGWEDRCIFFYDTYDGWIPTYCRPYGRTY